MLCNDKKGVGIGLVQLEEEASEMRHGQLEEPVA
jgi:hypothetical protein